MPTCFYFTVTSNPPAFHYLHHFRAFAPNKTAGYRAFGRASIQHSLESHLLTDLLGIFRPSLADTIQ
uniref:Uncharacterized protein n=2 Tax=Picea TaxID=3328 RepID=A0A117NG83_PICGL|nr:hypothetical protein ABT39_MTgene1484 [Picea glauca]QHR92668.1 hypothetical protein Q903MT_gene6716 [Picea sitchensis]